MPEGSALVCGIGTVGKFGWATSAVCTNQQINSAAFHAELVPRFSHFAMWGLQCEFERRANKVTIAICNKSAMGEVSLPIPPASEQQVIAWFLDRETAKIDALVEKKERLIELLQKKRTALITHAVTKGLDPDVLMRDSGIEWLGLIPAHWEVMAFRRLCTRVDVGIAEAATHAYCDAGVPIVRSTNVRPNWLDTADLRHIEPWFASKNHSKILRTGDLVTVRTGYPGTTAVIPSELEGSQCFTLVISTLRMSEIPDYFSHFFNSEAGRTYFEMEGWGSAQTNISVPIVQSIPVARPPSLEQQAIVDFLDRETAKIDALIAKVGEAIERLKEYRTALISAAVTGKIDVRDQGTIGGADA